MRISFLNLLFVIFTCADGHGIHCSSAVFQVAYGPLCGQIYGAVDILKYQSAYFLQPGYDLPVRLDIIRDVDDLLKHGHPWTPGRMVRDGVQDIRIFDLIFVAGQVCAKLCMDQRRHLQLGLGQFNAVLPAQDDLVF